MTTRRRSNSQHTINSIDSKKVVLEEEGEKLDYVSDGDKNKDAMPRRQMGNHVDFYHPEINDQDFRCRVYLDLDFSHMHR